MGFEVFCGGAYFLRGIPLWGIMTARRNFQFLRATFNFGVHDRGFIAVAESANILRTHGTFKVYALEAEHIGEAVQYQHSTAETNCLNNVRLIDSKKEWSIPLPQMCCNLSDNFTIDKIHSCDLGTGKDIAKLWFDSTSQSEEYYIKPGQVRL